jgi:hypothetical protein
MEASQTRGKKGSRHSSICLLLYHHMASYSRFQARCNSRFHMWYGLNLDFYYYSSLDLCTIDQNLCTNILTVLYKSIPDILRMSFSESTRMFSGFKSRWHIPFLWQWLTPLRICLKYRLACYSVRPVSLFSLILSKRSPPVTSSRTKKIFELLALTSTNLITLA